MAKLNTDQDGSLVFWCPGCEDQHRVTPEGVQNGSAAKWSWNGSMDSPTLTPSILVRCGHYAYDEPREKCWCTYNQEHPDESSPFNCYRCHSFVTDGTIQFLGDCSHALAGQTVTIPEWKEESDGGIGQKS